MPTRFYLPSQGDAGAAPAFDGAWHLVGEAARRRMFVAPLGSAMATATVGETEATPVNILCRQFVSDPIQAQTVGGTLKGQIRAQKTGSPSYTRLVARVVSGDGSAVRGTLLAMQTGPNVQSISTTMKNREIPEGWASPGIALADVNALAGDRIALEVGLFADNTSKTLKQFLFSFGDDAASDLPEDETTTAALNPWIELSGTIAFVAAGGGGAAAKAADIGGRRRR